MVVFFQTNPMTGVTKYIGGTSNGQRTHSTLNSMLEKQRAHQIIQKYEKIKCIIHTYLLVVN